MGERWTLGAHHIGLAVPDLDAALGFFRDLLGYDLLREDPDYPAAFVSDGTLMITLWRVADPATAHAFDRRANVGLHHLALKVADETVLNQLHDKVRAHPGVVIEFAPQPIRTGSPMKHFICAMPGGIRIEFATAG